jgi:hypothetical protein
MFWWRAPQHLQVSEGRLPLRAGPTERHTTPCRLCRRVRVVVGDGRPEKRQVAKRLVGIPRLVQCGVGFPGLHGLGSSGNDVQRVAPPVPTRF